MWRCLEVNFGMAAACFPAIYPGYRAIRQRISKYSSQRYNSGEKTQSDKARIWLNQDKSTRNTRSTAAASTGGAVVNPDIPIPEAAILTSTEFGVQHRSKSDDSGEELMKGTNDVPRGSAEPGTRWYSQAESSSEEQEERSTGHANMPRTTTSLV